MQRRMGQNTEKEGGNEGMGDGEGDEDREQRCREDGRRTQDNNIRCESEKVVNELNDYINN